jgi:hypothetical protein
VKGFSFSTTVFCLAGALLFSGVGAAETTPPPRQGEGVIASADVTATVTKIDQATREVTLKSETGEEFSFVAGDNVKNLAQVKVGDVVTATYAEAFVYEVKKGGTVADVKTVVAGESAKPGMKPEGAVARQSTATVLITAIDPQAPSVTFKGPAGNTRTIKVMHPEKLEGVSVGDTVEITYTEALAIQVEEAPKK